MCQKRGLSPISEVALPRTARFVVPERPHHVTQRGNRQQDIFLQSGDQLMYKQLLAAACERHRVDCIAWCLMTNHVHLVLVPGNADGLRAVMSSVHTAYSQRINLREGTTGHLFQGRFASYAMDDPHMMAAVRYVENNPVAAGLVASAAEWPWSSARAHIANRPDGLTARCGLMEHYPNWAAALVDGWEEGDREGVEFALQSGKPRGSAAWKSELSAASGRDLTVRAKGRPLRVAN